MTTRVVVVGAGLVGALWSVFLGRRGFSVDVYERRPDPRSKDAERGRSINLALSDRGFRALARVGLEEPVRAIGLPMFGRAVHDRQGNVVTQPYGKPGQAIFSVSRAALNTLLIEAAAEMPNVRMHFDAPIVDVNLTDKRLKVRSGTDVVDVQADLIFATDGGGSQVRQAMMRQPRFDYSQSFLAHGYKELALPADDAGRHQLAPDALHIWPRQAWMLIALPNLDGSFTCTLFLPFDGTASFAMLDHDDALRSFFASELPDAAALLPDLVDQFRQNPTSPLGTIRCSPWQVDGALCLLGDAAHAIVPFYGQGMNAGFEDCVVLDDLYAESEDWDDAIRTFAQVRKPDADAIATLAVSNFVEMRDKVADPVFLRMKQIEQRVLAAFPERYQSLYSLVTFSQVPYREALARGAAQEELLRDLALTFPDDRDQDGLAQAITAKVSALLIQQGR